MRSPEKEHLKLTIIITIIIIIYPSADLPSIFIKHFTNKVEKLRANIASEHVTSTLVTGKNFCNFFFI